MSFVRCDWDRDGTLFGLAVELHVEVDLFHLLHQALVERRHRLGFKRETPGETVTRQNREPMADEVEIDLERAVPVRNGRRGQASGRNVKRAMPAMIHPGSLCETDLSNDLSPHVQGGVGFAPSLE